jgi:hypothetical protein
MNTEEPRAMTTEEAFKALRLVYQKQRLSRRFWFVSCAFAAIVAFWWSWLAIPILIPVSFVANSLLVGHATKRIQKQTGLTPIGQWQFNPQVKADTAE